MDGKNYKATQGLWELLTQSRADKHQVTHQDRQAYKQVLLQSNALEQIIVLQARSKRTRALNIRGFFRSCFTHKGHALGIVELIIMSLGIVYYDPKHPASFGSVANKKKRDVEKWLSSQSTYTLQKQVRKRFPRNP